MIIGDKIATSNLTLNNTPQIVEVIAIEKHEIKWRHRFYVEIATELRQHWYIGDAHVDAWMRDDLSDDYYVVGRVRKRDRGITWCPAWIEPEVEALTVAAGLRVEPKWLSRK